MGVAGQTIQAIPKAAVALFQKIPSIWSRDSWAISAANFSDISCS